MEISKNQTGEILEVKIAGRLDGYWADDVRRTLLESVREGAHHIRLDISGIEYMSSIGLGALIEVHQKVAAIHGSFFLVRPSKNVLKLLQMSGVDGFLTDASVPVPSVTAPAQVESRKQERENCVLEIFDCQRGAELSARVIGRPDLLQTSTFASSDCTTVELPDSTMAIGLGALGDSFEDCRSRFGEFLAIGGAAAYQPTDGSGVPDHLIGKGTFIPSVEMLYGVVCDGGFSHVVHFHQKKEARPLTLSDLTQIALEVTQKPAVGIVLAAESAGLLGAWLRKSPAVENVSSNLFAYPMIRDWLTFAAERSFHRSMVLVSGIAIAGEDKLLQPFVRPLWRDPFPAGHFHAASFSYRPLKKGETDLKKVVSSLLAEEDLQGVLHLLSDDREAEGTGQSEFVRGACWIAPITKITPQEKS